MLAWRAGPHRQRRAFAAVQTFAYLRADCAGRDAQDRRRAGSATTARAGSRRRAGRTGTARGSARSAGVVGASGVPRLTSSTPTFSGAVVRVVARLGATLIAATDAGRGSAGRTRRRGGSARAAPRTASRRRPDPPASRSRPTSPLPCSVQLPRRRLTTSSSLEKRTKVPLMLRSDSWNVRADPVDAAVRARDAGVVDLHVGRGARGRCTTGMLAAREAVDLVAPGQDDGLGAGQAQRRAAAARSVGAVSMPRRDSRCTSHRLDAAAQAHEVEAAEHVARVERQGARAPRP